MITRNSIILPSAIAFVSLAAFTAIGQHASFATLDANDDFVLGTRATALTADGTTVVGVGLSQRPGVETEAFRWTAANAFEVLGSMPTDAGGPFANTEPNAVSADGSIIVGGAWTTGAAFAGRAFRWTEANGFDSLPNCVVGGDLRATALSADGTQIVGDVVDQPDPFFWDPPYETCRTVGFPTYPNTGSVLTTDIDAAGEITVGYLIQTAPARNFAVRWFADGSFEMFGEDRTPVSISADGTTVVSRFAYWTETSGWVGIPAAIPGSLFGRDMKAANADGSVIVGSDSPFLAGPPSAAIWDAANGSRLLQDELEQTYGLDLTGWNLQDAIDISDDGSVIVGNGIDPDGTPRAWRAVLGTPLFAVGDLNCDGIISVSDIGPFVLALTDSGGYAAQFPSCDINRADINNDQNVSVSDIGPFVQLLTAR